MTREPAGVHRAWRTKSASDRSPGNTQRSDGASGSATARRRPSTARSRSQTDRPRACRPRGAGATRATARPQLRERAQVHPGRARATPPRGSRRSCARDRPPSAWGPTLSTFTPAAATSANPSAGGPLQRDREDFGRPAARRCRAGPAASSPRRRAGRARVQQRGGANASSATECSSALGGDQVVVLGMALQVRLHEGTERPHPQPRARMSSSVAAMSWPIPCPSNSARPRCGRGRAHPPAPGRSTRELAVDDRLVPLQLGVVPNGHPKPDGRDGRTRETPSAGGNGKRGLDLRVAVDVPRSEPRQVGAGRENASFAASPPKPIRLERSGRAFAPSPLSNTWNQAKPPGGRVGSLLVLISPPILARFLSHRGTSHRRRS